MSNQALEAMRQALGCLIRAEDLYGQPNWDVQESLRTAIAQLDGQDVSGLGYELDGVIAEIEAGHPFDKVCLETVKRVRDALYLKERGKE